MEQEQRQQFAQEIAIAVKATKRPWWLSWGIPTVVMGLFSWLALEVYQGLKEGQKQATETNQAQNESLAVTAQVLKTLQGDVVEMKTEIITARIDPWTGEDDNQRTSEVLKRIDRNETRIDRLEQKQQTVLIESERVNATLEALSK